jgi:glycosyltransferase
MNQLFFSIITATKDPENILPTLNSLKNQNFKNYENIIIDSSSKPLKKKIEKKFSFRYFYNKKLSLYQALNFGIKNSRGKVIFFLHSDDILNNKKILKKIEKVFKKNKSSIVYGDIEMFSNRLKRVWKAGNFVKKKIYLGWHPPHTAFFCKKILFNKFGFFNTNYSIASDYDLMLRLLISVKTEKIKYLPLPITKMKIGGKSNKSLKNIVKSNLEVIKILKALKINNYLKIIFFKLFSKIFQIRFK